MVGLATNDDEHVIESTVSSTTTTKNNSSSYETGVAVAVKGHHLQSRQK